MATSQDEKPNEKVSSETSSAVALERRLVNDPDEHVVEGLRGVERMEAVTKVWSTASLVGVYCMLWLLYFLFALERSFFRLLGPYITSDFGHHAYISIVSVVSSIAGAAIYLPMAKALNMYGRAESLAFMGGLATIGLIVTASATSIASFSVGSVFTTVGYSGAIYAVDVITADTSILRGRALAYSFTASPYIVTAFAGSRAAQSLAHNFRWGFGSLAIVTPVIVGILYLILLLNTRRAMVGKPKHVASKKERNLYQSVWSFIIEYDVMGICVFVAGLVLFLLPFTLAEAASSKWREAYIIVMLVLGFVLLCLFPVLERKVPVPFAPWNLLTTDTLLLVCVVNALFSMARDAWNNYYSSYLQVVYDLSVSYTGYITSIQGVVSGVWQIIVGLLILWTGRYKWVLLVAIPIYALFIGLLIYFRRPETAVGLVVMCQIFLALASSAIILCLEVSAVAAVDHTNVAVAIGLLGCSGYIGDALGGSISGAIWTNTLPNELVKRLPDNLKDQAAAIYADLDTQLEYKVGTPERTAIIGAYGVAQTRMLIAGAVITGAMLTGCIFLRNIDLRENPQVDGKLFGSSQIFDKIRLRYHTFLKKLKGGDEK